MADHADFTPSAFTIEAFVNFDGSFAAFNDFIGQWGAATNNRSWGFGTRTTNGRLSLLLNDTGLSGGTESVDAPSAAWDLALDKDYYVAVTWDGALSGATNNGVTFYLKNLTDDTALITASVDHNTSALFASSTNIAIHGLVAGSATNGFNGYLDELRFSNSVLTLDELLITEPFVPEPSTLTLLGLGMLGMNARRRRKPLHRRGAMVRPRNMS